MSGIVENKGSTENSPEKSARGAVKNLEEIETYEFTEESITQISDKLLKWYDKNKRKLPWRKDFLTEEKLVEKKIMKT